MADALPGAFGFLQKTFFNDLRRAGADKYGGRLGGRGLQRMWLTSSAVDREFLGKIIIFTSPNPKAIMTWRAR